MENDNQIIIPPSFMALYLEPGRQKPSASHAQVLARYELCEDLANMLIASASNLVHSLNISEKQVLERCRVGLTGEDAVVTETEVDWVLLRLTELLDW